MKGQRISVTALTVLTLLILQAVLLLPLRAQSASAGPSKNDAAPLLQSILIAHRAWATPPASIQIRGASVRGGTRQPVTITATQKEEAVIAYGSTKRVATPSNQFQDDGQKSSFADVPSGFDQLDITGIFLISQMTRRYAKAGIPEVLNSPEFPSSKAGRVIRIHFSGGRTQTHFRQISVIDELDVLVAPSGLLAGIERTFYPEDSRLRYTVGYRFSDYRDTGGVLLPYRIDSTFKGNIEETIVVADYQVDVPATPSLFESRSQSRRTQ